MRNAYLSAVGFILLFGLCFYAKANQKPSQPKQINQGLPQYVIPLMEYYDSRSPNGKSWQPLDRYVFEFREGGVWVFMSKFPQAPKWVAQGRLRFCRLAGHNKAEIVAFAKQGYTFFKQNPPLK